MTLTNGRASTRLQDFDRRRPRLLSYMGRWGRARRWLPKDARLVLDIGCASGYGTAALASRGPADRWIAGLEYDAGLVGDASQRYPWLPLLCGDAAALPFRDATADAVLLLDVLEHLPDQTRVLREAQRVLRPAGYLFLTVPHRGLTAGLDANNAYAALRRRWPSLPAMEAYDQSATDTHRHFTLDEVRALLGPAFKVDRVTYTGLGIAEGLHIAVLMGFRVLLNWSRAYVALRYLLHFNMYLIEDWLPAGPLGYHLSVRAHRA